jgi:biopolymer transport protein ExbB/TolQ
VEDQEATEVIEVGAFIKSFIYVLSSSLLYPTLFLLMVLSVWLLFHAGGFFAEWLTRLRLPKTTAARIPDALGEPSAGKSFPKRVAAYLETLQGLLAEDPPPGEPVIVKQLEDASSAIHRSLDKVRLVVRIGPGLGLIGTLIPMGTGLAALGQGDLTQLSSDLVIAFTTTVVGLALGITSFFIYTIRKRWADDDIRTMEFITEILLERTDDEAQANES